MSHLKESSWQQTQRNDGDYVAKKCLDVTAVGKCHLA
jgi:hypothetical protein